MNKKVFVLLTVFVFLLTNSTFALVLSELNDQLIGATGVNVNGSLYDVHFVDGTGESVFGPDYAFTFDLGTAEFAAQALLDQVLVGDYDNSPEKTAGIDNPLNGYILTAYGINSAGTILGKFTLNYGSLSTGSDKIGNINFNKTYDLSQTNTFTWAQWSAQPVPEPGTVTLLGAGLVGFIVFMRKRHED